MSMRRAVPFLTRCARTARSWRMERMPPQPPPRPAPMPCPRIAMVATYLSPCDGSVAGRRFLVRPTRVQHRLAGGLPGDQGWAGDGTEVLGALFHAPAGAEERARSARWPAARLAGTAMLIPTGSRRTKCLCWWPGLRSGGRIRTCAGPCTAAAEPTTRESSTRSTRADGQGHRHGSSVRPIDLMHGGPHRACTSGTGRAAKVSRWPRQLEAAVRCCASCWWRSRW